MKRIFIAIPIPENIVEHIRNFKNAHASLPGRWTAEKNLHITLIPPMQLSDESFHKLIQQLQKVPKQSPFPIHFDTVSYGPSVKSPRLIWAIGPAPVELLQLKKNIENEIKYLPDRKTFTMHITLARFKPADFSQSPIKDLPQPVHWKMLADSFVVMESKLSSEGADYTILETFTLL